jgi:hypothetical protein
MPHPIGASSDMQQNVYTDAEHVISPDQFVDTQLPAEGDDAGYQYGVSSGGGSTSTYISDGELLAWLESKSNEIYGRLRGEMDVSRQRSKLMEDLSHFKTLAESGPSPETMDAEMAKIEAAYAGTEFEGEIAELFAPLHGVTDVYAPIWEDAPSVHPAYQFQTDRVAEQTQAKVDSLGRDDQLAMLHIQELMSDLRQTTQLGSNIMANRDQSSNTIVGNIRG